MYYFLISDHGGGGRAVRLFPKIEKILKERGIQYTYWKSSSNHRAVEIVQEVCNSGDKDARFIVMGGDGTVNAVLNGIPDFSALKLGLIPTGSGNDFARGIGVTRNYKKALEKILASKGDHKIDLGQVAKADGSRHIFGISCGFGMDAIIGRKADTASYKKFLNKLRLGKLIYVVASLDTLAHLKCTDVKLRIDGSETRYLKRVFYLAFMNCRTEGGGVPMAPNATNDDKKLSVGMGIGVKRWQGFFYFPLILLGLQNKFKAFSEITCDSIELTSEEPQTCHYDGEALGENSNLKVEILPQKLTVLV
ncbi:MAG: diacylglycerol kinase family lipid kinase [Treponema sp.]|nr:diacylglycerol kinase family lipid kinase [Treponema sp.]